MSGVPLLGTRFYLQKKPSIFYFSWKGRDNGVLREARKKMVPNIEVWTNIFALRSRCIAKPRLRQGMLLCYYFLPFFPIHGYVMFTNKLGCSSQSGCIFGPHLIFGIAFDHKIICAFLVVTDFLSQFSLLALELLIFEFWLQIWCLGLDAGVSSVSQSVSLPPPRRPLRHTQQQLPRNQRSTSHFFASGDLHNIRYKPPFYLCIKNVSGINSC